MMMKDMQLPLLLLVEAVVIMQEEEAEQKGKQEVAREMRTLWGQFGVSGYLWMDNYHLGRVLGVTKKM